MQTELEKIDAAIATTQAELDGLQVASLADVSQIASDRAGLNESLKLLAELRAAEIDRLHAEGVANLNARRKLEMTKAAKGADRLGVKHAKASADIELKISELVQALADREGIFSTMRKMCNLSPDISDSAEHDQLIKVADREESRCRISEHDFSALWRKASATCNDQLRARLCKLATRPENSYSSSDTANLPPSNGSLAAELLRMAEENVPLSITNPGQHSLDQEAAQLAEHSKRHALKNPAEPARKSVNLRLEDEAKYELKISHETGCMEKVLIKPGKFQPEKSVA